MARSGGKPKRTYLSGDWKRWLAGKPKKQGLAKNDAAFLKGLVHPPPDAKEESLLDFSFFETAAKSC